MKGKKFVWLKASAVASGGKMLDTNKAYDVKDFGEKIVDIWIRDGYAKYEDEEPEKKEKKSKGGE